MVHHQRKIAIIGAGFAGLAAGWYLLNLPNAPAVTLFSKGKEASRMSAGVLHKYMGQYAKLNPLANEAENETHQLLRKAQAFSNEPLILSKGLIRAAKGEKQTLAYQSCAEMYPDVTFLDNCQSLDPHILSSQGIFIESGLIINAPAYLDALKEGCVSKGLIVINKEIFDLAELDEFDHIISAMGFLTPSLFKNTHLHPLKGQLLEIRWPEHLPPLPFAIVSQIYIAMTSDPRTAIIGATYEHVFESDQANPKHAIDVLYPKALELYPDLAGAKILDVKVGIRATTPNRLPIAEVISRRFSILTGFGSRGLLYHASFAKKLISDLQKTA